MLIGALLLGGLAGVAVLLLPTRAADPSRPGQRSPDQSQDAVTAPGSVRAGRDADILSMLDDLAAGLEAGLPVSRAVTLSLDRHQTQGEHRHAWSVLSKAALEGHGLAPAWARVARASRSETLVSVARAWRVASLTGAPLSQALRVSAATARERLRLERAVEAATAGARATATVLTGLPVAGVLLAALLGVPPTQLYGSAVAWASVGLGVILLVAGHVLVRRLVHRVLRGLR